MSMQSGVGPHECINLTRVKRCNEKKERVPACGGTCECASRQQESAQSGPKGLKVRGRGGEGGWWWQWRWRQWWRRRAVQDRPPVVYGGEAGLGLGLGSGADRGVRGSPCAEKKREKVLGAGADRETVTHCSLTPLAWVARIVKSWTFINLPRRADWLEPGSVFLPPLVRPLLLLPRTVSMGTSASDCAGLGRQTWVSANNQAS